MVEKELKASLQFVWPACSKARTALPKRGRRERRPEIPTEGEMPVGMKIRARRWARGLTARELADASGYSRTHVSHVEVGSANADEEFLNAISPVLEIKPDK